jgi:hypothetical protein
MKMKAKLTKEVTQQLREWARKHRGIPDEIVGRKIPRKGE